MEAGEYRETPKSETAGHYTTTGFFATGAPDARAEHLSGIPALFLDCDLCDHIIAQYPETDRTKQNRLVIKHTLHNLPDADLAPHIAACAARVNDKIRELTGHAATRTVSSGYGVHCYLWLQPEQATDLDLCRRAQTDLVRQINTLAGYELADSAVKDAGTRVLRTPGTQNNKGAIPRDITILYQTDSVFDARTLLAQPEAPASGLGLEGLFASIKDQTAKALRALFETCPFFLWAIQRATEVGLRSWYGAATNIAAIAGEAGRVEFHALSRKDPLRYDAGAADKQYTHALKHIDSGGGPWTYATLAANGDWPGPIPSAHKAPAVLAARGAQPEASSDDALVLDKHGFARKLHTNLRRILRTGDDWGSRLRWNEMAQCAEYDGNPIIDAFYGDVQENIQRSHSVEFSRDSVAQGVYETAYRNRYHPLVEYLRGLTWDGTDRINALLPAIRAEDTQLHRDYLRCFFVSAVRRGLCENVRGELLLDEGIKVDTTLVLHGVQGAFKSSLFNALARRWFSDTPMAPGTKDAYIAVSRHWLIEWAEFERAYSKDTVATKAFLSARRDSFRRPYARTEETQARRCIIVGTTNEDHFLHDPTGNRRFHILPVSGRIDMPAIQAMRDQLWAQAVVWHKQGVPHWLQSEAEAQRREANASFQLEEPWERLIARWLRKEGALRPMVTIEQVLQSCVQKPQDHWSRADTMEIGRVLQRLGYQRRRITLEGQRGYVYLLPGADPETEIAKAAAPRYPRIVA